MSACEFWPPGCVQNTASRMESNSRPGHMRISEATYNLLPTVVKSQFTPEMIEAKGKGTLQTWIVDCQQSLIGV